MRRSAPAISIPVGAGRVRRWFTAVLGLSFVLAATWGVTHSRVFELRTLRVSGNSRLSSARVASLGGVTSRTNILWMSTRAVEQRLERNPWIKEARVSRTLPSVLTIAITERTPAAILNPSGLLVAPDGMILGKAEPSARLPRIEGTADATETTTSIRTDLPALSVIRSLPPDLVPLVAGLALDRWGRLVLTLRDGTRVLLGDASEAAAKGEALDALLRWMDRTGARASSIDLTVATAPALRPAA